MCILLLALCLIRNMVWEKWWDQRVNLKRHALSPATLKRSRLALQPGYSLNELVKRDDAIAVVDPAHTNGASSSKQTTALDRHTPSWEGGVVIRVCQTSPYGMVPTKLHRV